MLLTQGEQAQSEAKQQYQQAQTAADIQTAITSWQAAIDQSWSRFHLQASQVG